MTIQTMLDASRKVNAQINARNARINAGVASLRAKGLIP